MFKTSIIYFRVCISIYFRALNWLYRVSLNSHYRLWGLVVGIKTVRFSIGTHVRKRTVSPLQPKHLHITCWTLPLLLLALRCYSGSTDEIGSMWRPGTSTHTRYFHTMFPYTWSQIPYSPTSVATITSSSRSSSESTGISKTKIFMWPHRKWSSGVRSGECAG